jgi:Uma2 family endonuclease
MTAAVAAEIAELGFGLKAPADVDERVILTGITWQQYEVLLALFGDDQPGIRVAYLEGKLEIMSPSRKRERIKKTFARLVELYAVERDVPLTGLGSTTFREAAKQRGVEPDECYCVGDEKDLPDIAFEVIVTSGGLDKLAIYGGLGVPEVWFWRSGRFLLFGLDGAGYRRVERSRFLPDLDLTRLAALVEADDQTRAVREFRDALRAERQGR